MTAYWLGVASREHVRLAVLGGFCQLDHGKEAPMKRLRPGDRIVYYSPRAGMRSGELVQSFTALGEVLQGEPLSVSGSGDCTFHRRAVRYEAAQDVSVRPLLSKLAFTRGESPWGQALRRGTIRITAEDYALIAQVAGVQV